MRKLKLKIDIIKRKDVKCPVKSNINMRFFLSALKPRIRPNVTRLMALTSPLLMVPIIDSIRRYTLKTKSFSKSVKRLVATGHWL